MDGTIEKGLPALTLEFSDGGAVKSLPSLALTFNQGETLQKNLPALTLSFNAVEGVRKNLPALTLTFRSEGGIQKSLPALTLVAATSDGFIKSLPALTLVFNSGGVINAFVPYLFLEFHSGNGIHVSLGKLELSSTDLSTLTTLERTLPPLTVVFNSGAVLQPVLPVLTVSASGLAGDIASASLRFPALTISGTGQAGTVVSMSVSIPRLSTAATAVTSTIGAASLGLPPILVTASALVGTNGRFTLNLPDLGFAATVASGLIATVSMTLPGLNTSAIITIPLNLALIPSPIDAVAGNSLCYALNLKHFGLSSYSGFSADSFAVINGKLVMANADGLWEAQDTKLDDTAYVSMRVRGGYSAMGATNAQRVTHLIVNARSSRALRARVLVDSGETYAYQEDEPIQSGIRQHRIKIGEGLRAKYRAVEIYNHVGSDLDLTSVEPLTLQTRRRVG